MNLIKGFNGASQGRYILTHRDDSRKSYLKVVNHDIARILQPTQPLVGLILLTWNYFKPNMD